MKGKKRIDLEKVKNRVAREGAHALLTRGEAAALLADRLKKETQTQKQARNDVAMQLERAGVTRSPDGKYLMDTLSVWATRKHGDKFKDLPFHPRGRGYGAPDMVKGIGGPVLPSTLEGSHQVIESLLKVISELFVERDALIAERAELRKKRTRRHPATAE